MYKNVPFRVSPIKDVEEDLEKLQSHVPDAERIHFVGANPFALSFELLKERCLLVKKYLPEVKEISMSARVTDIKNKTVEQLKELRSLSITELYIGHESGDDWTLQRINKGYTSKDILEQCHKLEAAGIVYWTTFLNGVAGVEHSRQHAINSAKIFSRLKSKVVGSGSLTMFPGTELANEAGKGEFVELNEKERMEELKLFLENLDTDTVIVTHHTSALQVGGKFPENKKEMIDTLQYAIDHYDELSNEMNYHRNNIRTL
jgi:radical SAM superfamily enzyme YgiQ (UPF0313 family)